MNKEQFILVPPELHQKTDSLAVTDLSIVSYNIYKVLKKSEITILFFECLEKIKLRFSILLYYRLNHLLMTGLEGSPENNSVKRSYRSLW